MRRAAYVAAAAGLALAHPAYADGNPPPEASAAAAGSAVMVAVMPLVPALQRVDFTVEPPRVDDPFNRLKGALRHRFASAMIDLYPVSRSGFHLSFGTRFFRRWSIQRDQQEATRGLLFVPRLPRGGFGQRGFRRATAAATFGYTQLVGHNLMLGVEGGTLLGHVVQPLPHGNRLAGLPGERDRNANMRMNPVLNFTVAYAF